MEQKLNVESRKQRLEREMLEKKPINPSRLSSVRYKEGKTLTVPCAGCGGEKIDISSPQNIENVLREHLTGE